MSNHNTIGKVKAANTVCRLIIVAIKRLSPPKTYVSTYAADAVGKAKNKTKICDSKTGIFKL